MTITTIEAQIEEAVETVQQETRTIEILMLQKVEAVYDVKLETGKYYTTQIEEDDGRIETNKLIDIQSPEDILSKDAWKEITLWFSGDKNGTKVKCYNKIKEF